MKIKIQHKISKTRYISQSQFKGRIFVICKLELLKPIIILIADSFKSRILEFENIKLLIKVFFS